MNSNLKGLRRDLSQLLPTFLDMEGCLEPPLREKFKTAADRAETILRAIDTAGETMRTSVATARDTTAAAPAPLPIPAAPEAAAAPVRTNPPASRTSPSTRDLIRKLGMC